MENRGDFYNNNRRLRGQQPTVSRADMASSWRSQRDQILDNPTKKRRNLGDKPHDGPERLNCVYNTTIQRDNRVSLWCGDVQRHHVRAQPTSAFTVFSDSQSNQSSPAQQTVGSSLNASNPSVVLLSPLQQSMNMPTLVNSIPPLTFTSALLRSPEMALQRLPESQFGFSQIPSFNQPPNVSENLTNCSPPFSPWSNNANMLQLRDANQRTLFNSSMAISKHNEVANKPEDICNLNAPNKQATPTWSEIAAGDPEAYNRRLSTVPHSGIASSSKAKEAIFSKVEQESSASGNMMDVDMQDVASTFSTAMMAPPIRGSRYITDSLAFISSGVSNDQNISVDRPYTVLKVKNISWNVSESDVSDALSRYKAFRLPDVKKLPQCIHILMDVKSGKTLNTAYVELEMSALSDNQINSVIRTINIPQAQGRHISICRSSYDELCNELFSNWRGQFKNGIAHPYTDSRDSSTAQKSQYYISQKDLQRLLNVCRFFKTYYNRKCAERPFEYLITIIMNMPWKQPHAVTTAQRDIIYECYKLATEALFKHVNRTYHSFDDELLPRMVRAAIICDGFTVKQKKVVLSNAKMACPKDLESFVQEPALNASGFTTFLR
ncbi:hypothetical protein BD408DRAFT_444941 [Parasitella parasitica]|nr:hypothetical protein BD408DRAFT_444941 [Parasitella parasitica]